MHLFVNETGVHVKFSAELGPNSVGVAERQKEGGGRHDQGSLWQLIPDTLRLQCAEPRLQDESARVHDSQTDDQINGGA